MKRDAVIRDLRREARSSGLAFELDKTAGKGSHYRVRIGDRLTTIPSGDLSPHFQNKIRRDLGLR